MHQPVRELLGALALFAVTGLAGAACSLSTDTSSRQYFTKLQCGTCHSNSGLGTGPSLKGVAGTQVRLADGKTITRDDEYLRRSIVEPDADIVEGYGPGMMSSVVAAHQADLANPDVVAGLVEYIKALK